MEVSRQGQISLFSPIVMDFETYAAINGGSRQDIGEAALHRSSLNKSPNTHRMQVLAQARKDHLVILKRDELRDEYDDLVGAGVYRPLTQIERLLDRASGDPEFESVQAARRVLTKRGYDWSTGECMVNAATIG
ncbi:MAG: hypothetical protein ACTS9Y_00465 [Methylophilus sp.]|uniref:hypothetical protein n=1 Tax=Methylophilus sp. TaxID=29541 RepID=UPI003F9EF40B